MATDKLPIASRRHVSAPEVIVLRWNESESLPGLWVRCSTRIAVGDLAAMSSALKVVSEDQITDAAELFAPCLLAWNEAEPELDTNGEYVYGDDGEVKAVDVPATEDGWRSRNPLMQVNIMSKYFAALGGISVPKLPPSPNGAPLEALSGATAAS